MPLQILLADENPAVQKLVELTLSQEGMGVTTTDNGLSALDIAIKNPPDLILADFKMEGLDISSFVRKTKKREHLNGIPIVLLINSTETFDPVYLQSLGVDGFFKKPIDTQELIDGIKKLTSVSDSNLDQAEGIPTPETSDLAKHFTSTDDDSDEMGKLLGWSSPDESQQETELLDAEQTIVSPAPSEDPISDTVIESDSPEYTEEIDEQVQVSPFEDEVKPSEEIETVQTEPEATASAPLSFPFGEDETLAQPEISNSSPEVKTGYPSPVSEPHSPERPEKADEQVQVSPFEDNAEPSKQETSFVETSQDPAPLPPFDPSLEMDTVQSSEDRPTHLDQADDQRTLDEKDKVQASTERIAKDRLPDEIKLSVSDEMIAEIVKEIVWEVVPAMAEAEIKKAIEKLQTDRK